MNNKKLYITAGITVLVIIVATLSKIHPVSQGASTNQPVVSKAGAAEVPSNDPQDIVPGMYKNQISNTSTAAGLAILSGIAENNVDTNGKITNDHLELSLKNSSAQDMTGVEMYYTIKDLTTDKSEGYYKKLTGFVLKAGATQSVHFDNKVGNGHFGINKSGVYFTSVNKLQFDVQVSVLQYQIARIQIMKDAGGAEIKD